MALGVMLDLGSNNLATQNSAADAIVELVSRRCVAWSIFGEFMASAIEGLEELRIDCPHCDEFVHLLLGRLFQKLGRDFDPIVLEHLPRSSGKEAESTWRLLVGALKKVKRDAGRRGSDNVRKLLDLVPQLAGTLCRVSCCSRQDLKKRLQDESCA